MEEYFKEIEQRIQKVYSIAEKARRKGVDPKTEIETSFAKDLAERVEELVGPKGIAKKIRKYLKKYGREETAIQIALEIAESMEGDFASVIEQAVRTGLAILTEGVLVAPIEGISRVEIGKNDDGTRYVDLYFAGPIRSAGGTGEAMSVLIADVVRRRLGIDRYKPTDDEVERYKEEIPLYDRVSHLQYLPSPEEIETIVRNCPICINGEATEDREVMGKRDLPRVKTNKLRGGACLVIAEGLSQKAPKILKHVSNLGLKGWEFLNTFVKESGTSSGIAPSEKYIKDLIAGRPVFSHPSRKGGFRLRYGRCRTCGLAATAIHPATMYLVKEFIAIGTQLKTERPGKGTVATPCDSIEGPMVLLDNGDFIQLNSIEDAKKYSSRVKQIIDLGEILVPFGEFAENNAILPPASYCHEWWEQELKEAGGKYEGVPDAFEAFRLSEEYGIPLHPAHTFFWHDVGVEDILYLRQQLKKASWDGKNLVMEKDEKCKKILLELGVLHLERDGYIITNPYPLIRCLGYDIEDNKLIEKRDGTASDSIELVSQLAGVKIMPKAPHRIGARMGRPEKAAARIMKASPHVLYPVGEAGGRERLITSASWVEVEMGERRCEKCGNITYKARCEKCGGHTYFTGRISKFRINPRLEIENAASKLNVEIPPKVKGVIGLSSKSKTPESIEKGLLRAKHGVYVFKDGTARFDMTNMPITHFKPYEIGTSVEKLRELGYEYDWQGNRLERDDQICELKPQDIIPSIKAGEYMLRVTKFIDEMLTKVYGMGAFYKAESVHDLVGHLVVGLSPHTSAGIVGRIIGFIDANVGGAHPFFHAAKRRNCDGDEDAIMMLLDVLINFSYEYIPEKRGGKMDLPVVIATRIIVTEIDKEGLNIDLLSKYPLQFFRKTMEYPHPKELEKMMELVSSRIGSGREYEGFGFTHDTTNINDGPKTSAYKLLNKMEDKLNAQMELAVKIRAVDEGDVASRIIQTHFLPDLMGNMRAFTRQQFRCSKCNKKFRRVPLTGKCPYCGGNIIMTVHEKSIKKYLEPAKNLVENFDVPEYTRQRILLFEKFVDSLFKNDRVKNTTLKDFF